MASVISPEAGERASLSTFRSMGGMLADLLSESEHHFLFMAKMQQGFLLLFLKDLQLQPLYLEYAHLYAI